MKIEVADYVASTGNHVLYRVTPAFAGTELVARGVEMEAYSVEDRGPGRLLSCLLLQRAARCGDRLRHRGELGGMMELWNEF